MAMVGEVMSPMEVDEQPQSPSAITPQVQRQECSGPATVGLTPTMNASNRSSINSRPEDPDEAFYGQSPVSLFAPLLPFKSFQPIQPNLRTKGTNGKPMREYHPDKHCGVWNEAASRHCTRAISCKNHSASLKRQVDGRSKPFDELLIEHKKAQAGLAAATTAGTSPPITSTVTTLAPSSMNPAFQPNGVIHSGGISLAKPPAPILFPQNPIQQPVPLRPQQRPFRVPAEDLEDSFHYTTQHPKPLSVCNFGGRRIGGLMSSDRSKLLTRKLVKKFC